MKIEINNENKKKFFGLYYGQKIYREHGQPLVNDWVDMIDDIDLDSYLSLKPLSLISDEDLIGLGQVLDPHKRQGEWDTILQHREEIDYLLDPEELLNNSGLSYVTVLNSIDYLRSRSYLLPWMGLSCEEIIEAGWAKYQKS